MKIKTYAELLTYPTYEERLNYLKTGNTVGYDTFGFDRYLNQMFYKSAEWRRLRNYVITRDNGCDLAIKDMPIMSKIYVHHINPLTKKDIIEYSKYLLDPNYLVCASFDSHQIIHYSSDNIEKHNEPIERKKFDTCPWR